MPILKDWDLIIDADQVIRGQGADPAVIRSRWQ
jgi:pseudouridine-5'-phosphate glycosidase